MFENNKISFSKVTDTIHYSRFIASFYNEGGEIDYHGEFRAWLESIGISSEDIRNIMNMANCGKYELELSARAFIKKYREEHQEE